MVGFSIVFWLVFGLTNTTIEKMCFLLQAEPLPEYVFDLLEETPFIRYEADRRRYVPHAILREMLLRRLGAADKQTQINCYSRAPGHGMPAQVKSYRPSPVTLR